MTRWAVVAILLLGSIGCGGRQMPPVRTTSNDPQFFVPESMHLSPVFTKVTDFDGDNTPDGIESVVELQDRFGDPTKAVGRIVFQIYRFKPYSPDPRGDRLAGPFEGRVDSAADQKARWSRVNRAYIFQLAFPQAALDKDYVVEAMFESASGARLFDRLMVEGDHTKPGATTGPAPLNSTTAPTTGTATGPTTQSTTQSTTKAQTSTTGAAAGSITTQEYRSVPTASQPHEPPPRNDQP